MQEQAMGNELRQTLTELATACRVLAMEGHEDGTQGHLSYRDPDGRGFWLTTFWTNITGKGSPGVASPSRSFSIRLPWRLTASSPQIENATGREIRDSGSHSSKNRCGLNRLQQR